MRERDTWPKGTLLLYYISKSVTKQQQKNYYLILRGDPAFRYHPSKISLYAIFTYTQNELVYKEEPNV